MNFRKIVEALSPSEFSYEIVVGHEKWLMITNGEMLRSFIKLS